jgi:hypothetical protein
MFHIYIIYDSFISLSLLNLPHNIIIHYHCHYYYYYYVIIVVVFLRYLTRRRVDKILEEKLQDWGCRFIQRVVRGTISRMNMNKKRKVIYLYIYYYCYYCHYY